MALPASFAKDGFVAPSQLPRKSKFRRLLIGTEGPTDSGKTEFALSAPGPGIVIAVDRNFDALLDNPNPPSTRRDDFAFKVVAPPMWMTATKEQYEEYWKRFRADFYAGLDNPDARTVVLDGDSDSWELQRLAAFGSLTQIPSIMYTQVNAARRALIARAWDSGKIVIATNKVKKKYETAYLPSGQVKTGNDGKEIREWDGKTYQRQGFEDTDYLWHIQLRHMHKPAFTNQKGRTVPQQWGVKILKCKANMELVGLELWGDECNMPTLLQVIYPNVPLSDWGY